MKLTPLTPLPPLPLSLAAASAAKPVSCELELPPLPDVRGADGAARTPPVEEPTIVGPAVVLCVPVPAVEPAVEPEVCGAAAVCGAGPELSPFTLDVVLTEVEPAVVGVVVLLVSVVTVA